MAAAAAVAKQGRPSGPVRDLDSAQDGARRLTTELVRPRRDPQPARRLQGPGRPSSSSSMPSGRQPWPREPAR